MSSSDRPRDRGRSLQITVVVATVAIVGIATLVGLAFAGSRHELAAGTRVAGVDVGGLSEREATATLEGRFEKVAAEPLTFVAEGKGFTFAADQLGVQPDWRAAVAAAAHQGEGFGPLQGFRRLHARFFGAEISPPVSVSGGALAFALGEIARSVDRPSRSAALVRHGLRISIRPERYGQRLDREAAAEVLVRSLGSLERARGAVTLPVLATGPPVTASMLQPAAQKAAVALSAPVVLRGAGGRWTLPPASVAELVSLPSAGATQLAIAGPAADEYFRALAARVDRRPADATFATSDDAVRVVPARDGLELDLPRTAQALLRAVTSPVHRVAALAVARTAPARSTADAKAMGIRYRLSTYETYNAGDVNRITNLRLGVEALDGTLVPPGGTFSLNRAIGERTAARGFRLAPVIIGTQYGEEIGGGTSQVATTVFNAAWEAGVRITERNPHALYISRYPLGRDATVYWPSLDLKFLNDTRHWILVKGYPEPNGIRVSIYGGERRRVVSSPGTMRTTGPIPVKRLKDRTLPKGETVVEQAGTAPSATSVTRTIYEDGKLLRTETWNTSYKGEAEIVRVGTKSKQKPTAKKKGQPTAPGTSQNLSTATSATTTTRP